MGRWLRLRLKTPPRFFTRLVAEFPQKIDAVTTDIRLAFVHLKEAFSEETPPRGLTPRQGAGPHPFAVACSAKGIVHKRTLLLSREPVSAEAAQTNAGGIQ